MHRGYVICADEKASSQARCRACADKPEAGRVRRVEPDYERRGALVYLAARDVRRASVLGLCEPATGTAPFRRLVDLVMQREPYRSARRVVCVTDDGSSYRGLASAARLRKWYPNAIQVAAPVNAS